jgi:hypothetical protein
MLVGLGNFDRINLGERELFQQSDQNIRLILCEMILRARMVRYFSAFFSKVLPDGPLVIVRMRGDAE